MARGPPRAHGRTRGLTGRMLTIAAWRFHTPQVGHDAQASVLPTGPVPEGWCCTVINPGISHRARIAGGCCSTGGVASQGLEAGGAGGGGAKGTGVPPCCMYELLNFDGVFWYIYMAACLDRAFLRNSFALK